LASAKCPWEATSILMRRSKKIKKATSTCLKEVGLSRERGPRLLTTKIGSIISIPTTGLRKASGKLVSSQGPQKRRI
jgi:hypothetical protein